MSNHKLYKDSSPYYQNVLNRYGRDLVPAYVEGILYEHSLNLADYLGDVALGELPAKTDAADLLAWLGY